MLIYDIETNGLLDELDRVHTLHILDKATGQRLRYNAGLFADGTPAPRDGTIEDGLRLLMEADEVCGHNIISFDIPALTKVYPWFAHRADCVIHDTLIYARLIYPHIGDIDSAASRKGKRPADFGRLTGTHSLKAWGIRLGVLKADYEGEWHSFTQEMEEYAAQDPVTTEALWDLVSSKGYAEAAIRLEHDVAFLIHCLERFGFAFNDAAADDLERILRGRKAELEDQLRETFPPWQEPERKGGKPVQFTPKRDNAKLGYVAGVPIQRYKTVSFNPSSRDHIANRLTALFDWSPVEFTDSGKPKVDETTLTGLDYPEAKLLTEYLTVDKRLGQLAEGKAAWRKKLRADGRIHGRINSLGAVTRRMTHSDPNLAQVPSCGAPYGPECRALFIVAPGRKLVGCDAEGLELRMLAHFLAKHDGGEYGKAVVSGDKSDGTDPHSITKRVVGLNSRDSAKTFIYAYLYGAGSLKLGTIIYDDYTEKQRTAFNAKFAAGLAREKALASLGLRAKKRVEQGIPALGRLQEVVKRIAAKGTITIIDGGAVRIRSAHAALNSLLQGSGSILVKKAMVMLFERLRAEGFVPNPMTGAWLRGNELIALVACVHDEVQLEADAHLAEWLGQLAADAMRDAGEALGLRVPTAGAFAVGDNWRDTH